jgi:hypothetical protein
MSGQSRPRWVPSVALFVVMFLMLSVTALYAATPLTTDAAASAATGVADDGPTAAQPATPASADVSNGSSTQAQPVPLFAPRSVRATRRPAALLPLYVGFATLQALDARSTMTALGNGATEANPLLGGITDHSGAFLALKMGAAAGTIFVTEKLWKRNPVAAVALMVGLNSAYAIIVAHNYQVARGMR